MPDWLLQLIGMAGLCVGAYAGVRADLARAILKAENAEKCAGEAKEAATRAHDRIDGMLRGA